MCSLREAQARERIRTIVAGILDIPMEAVHAEDRFREDLGADSLDLVEIIIAVYAEFAGDVDIGDRRTEIYFRTIGEAAHCLYGQELN